MAESRQHLLIGGAPPSHVSSRPRAVTRVTKQIVKAKSTRFTLLDLGGSEVADLQEAHGDDSTALALEFLQLAFRSFEPNERSTGGAIFVSPQLGALAEEARDLDALGGGGTAGGRRSAGSNSAMELEAAREVERVDAHVGKQWADLRQQVGSHAPADLDDKVVVVLRSPHSKRSYVALGARRLYWFCPASDADEAMHAATPQSNEERERWYAAVRAGHSCTFNSADRSANSNLTRHALSGAVESPLAKESIEGARVCYLLNALHALLHRPAVPQSFGRQRSASAFFALALSSSSPSIGWDAHGGESRVSWEGLSHVAVSSKTYRANVREARRHAHDLMLLTPSGDLVPLTTPLDTHDGSFADLKAELGAGVGAYLKALWLIAGSFALAALLAIPSALFNLRGGVLSSLGYASIGSITSLGNVPAYAIEFWPVQSADLAAALILLVSFTWIRHAAARMNLQVGASALDPSHYTVFVSGNNLGLVQSTSGGAGENGASNDGGGGGAGANGAEAARALDVDGTVDAYRRFFAEACRREASGRHGVPPPDDHDISEVLLLRRSEKWMSARKALDEAEEQEQLAALREAAGVARGAAAASSSSSSSAGKQQAGLGAKLVDARTRLIGWAARRSGLPSDSLRGASAESSAHWQSVAQRQRDELDRMQSASAEDEAGEVVGALVVFNSSEAARKALHELGTASHTIDLQPPPDATSSAGAGSAGMRGRRRSSTVHMLGAGGRPSNDVERGARDGDDDDGLTPEEREEERREAATLKRAQNLSKLKGYFTSAQHQFRAANWMAAMSASSRAAKNAAEYAGMWIKDKVVDEQRQVLEKKVEKAQQQLKVEQVKGRINQTAGRVAAFLERRRKWLVETVNTQRERLAAIFGGNTPSWLRPSSNRARRATVRVTAALEPDDYIWQNMTASAVSRRFYGCQGWVMCLGLLAVIVQLELLAVSALPSMPLIRGSYTLTDQKCGDIAYLRSAPHAARSCGMGMAGIDPADMVASLIKGVCDGGFAATVADGSDVDDESVAEPTAGAAGAGDAAGGAAAAGRSLLQRVSTPDCPFGGGKLGDFLALTKCTTNILGGDSFTSFRSYDGWRAATEPNEGFAVSDAYGVYLPSCAFLSMPSGDGLGGYVVRDPSGEEVDMFCDYRADTSHLPYTMGGDFHCEAPLYHPQSTAGVTNTDGIADVLSEAACDEPNCLRCTRHFTACLEESRAFVASEKTLLADFHGKPITKHASMTYRQIVHGMRALVVGVLLTLVNLLLPVLASKVVQHIHKPSSYSEQRLVLMRTTFLLLIGHTLGALYLINRGSIGRLGFFTDGADQAYAVLVIHALVSQAAQWARPPILAFLRTGLAWAGTQPELNALYAPPEFDYPGGLAYALYLVYMGVALSTPLPLALPIVALALLARCVTEWLMMLRVYRKPPRYDAKLVDAFAGYLRFALVLKLASLWVFYSNTMAGATAALGLATILVLWWTITGGATHLPFMSPAAFAKHAKGRGGGGGGGGGSAVSSTVTHQTMRDRGEILEYDPLEFIVDEENDDLLDGLDGEEVDGAAAGQQYAAAAAAQDRHRQYKHPLPPPSMAPIRWFNTDPLHVITTCPNSHEAVRPLPDETTTCHVSQIGGVGECEWSRLHRLSGAEAFETFDTWREAKQWMEDNLRAPASSLEPIGPCADDAAASTRFVYTGMPTALLAPAREWSLLDRKAPSGKRTQEWVVCFTRDRAEFSSLQWKLIEADSREKLQKLLDEAMHGGSGYGDGTPTTNHRWTIQSVAAEVLTPDDGVDANERLAGGLASMEAAAADAAGEEGGGAPGRRRSSVGGGGGGGRRRSWASVARKPSVWVRWVAVLRAVPPTPHLAGTQEVTEWAVEGSIADVMQRQSMKGLELALSAGTPPESNARLLVFHRMRSSWARRQVVSSTPHFPLEWLRQRLKESHVIVSISYCAASWTIVVAQSDHAQPLDGVPGSSSGSASDDDSVLEEPKVRQALLFSADHWPPEDPSTSRELGALLNAGYKLSSLACGPPCLPSLSLPAPVASGLRSTYVAVLSRCPNVMAPREVGTRGALCYPLKREHLQGPPLRGYHRDWTKHEGCTVHATSTGNVSAGAVARPPRASYILDGNEHTFWRSESVGGSSSRVVVTIDLGEERAIDRIAIFWGGQAVEAMPEYAEVLLATADAVTFRPGATAADGSSDRQLEPGMRSGRYAINEELLGPEAGYKFELGTAAAEANKLLKGGVGDGAIFGETIADVAEVATEEGKEKKLRAAKAFGGGYVAHESVSLLAFDKSPRKARYVQLRLLEPSHVSPSGAYAIRNVLIVGPSDDGGMSAVMANKAASESIKRFFLAKDEVMIDRRPSLAFGFAEEMNAPDAASHAKKDERAAKTIVEWAVENQMKLNQKYATTVPRHPRFDPLPLMPSGAQLALGANEPRQEPPADLV